jgi:hypothetical protein
MGIKLNSSVKEISGDKYIYYAMAYFLAKNGKTKIGNDNGFVGGQKFARHFKVYETESKDIFILVETKFNHGNADFSRSFIVCDFEENQRVIVKEHVNENDENLSKRWVH